jgi:hypothetical protein
MSHLEAPPSCARKWRNAQPPTPKTECGGRLLPNTDGQGLVESARAWALEGWHVVPFKSDRSSAYVKFGSAPTPDADTVERMFKAWPHALLTIRLPADIVVLDLDPRGRSLAGIEGELSDAFDIPETATVSTPKGGTHLWYRLPDGFIARNWTSAHGKFPIRNVDIRTNGALATLPPSRRPDGAYHWRFWMPEVQLAPEKLQDALRPQVEPDRPVGHARPFVGQLTKWAEAALHGEIARVVNAPKGSRNQSLFIASARLAEIAAAGTLPERPVRQALYDAAAANGLLSEDQGGVLATIASGWSHGSKKPRKLDDEAF